MVVSPGWVRQARAAERRATPPSWRRGRSCCASASPARCPRAGASRIDPRPSELARDRRHRRFRWPGGGNAGETEFMAPNRRPSEAPARARERRGSCRDGAGAWGWWPSGRLPPAQAPGEHRRAQRIAGRCRRRDEVGGVGLEQLVGRDAGVAVCRAAREDTRHGVRAAVDRGSEEGGHEVDVDTLALPGPVALTDRGEDPDGSREESASTFTRAMPTLCGSPSAGAMMLISPSRACNRRS
jgi:hypothetical protein